LLQTVLVIVFGKKRHAFARALLDSSSQRSYVSKSLLDRLELPLECEKSLRHGLFGGTTTKPIKHDVHRVVLGSLVGDFECSSEALRQDILCGQVPVLTDDVKTAKLVYDIELPDIEGAPTELESLLGADIIGQLLEGEVKDLHNGGLVA